MSYRTMLIASLSAVALLLAGSETFADPGAGRGAGAAPQRPSFPQMPGRSMNHHHHQGHRGVGWFWPAGGGVFYGLPNESYEPAPVAPPLKLSDDIRFTCVYDIPWDYVHRCPQYNGPR